MNTQMNTERISMDASQGRLRAVESGVSRSLSPRVAELQVRLPASPVGHPGVAVLDGLCSPAGIRISLFDGERCVATGTVFPAERSALPQLTGLHAADLGASIGIGELSIDPTAGATAISQLLYLLLRRGRIWERQTVITYVAPAVLDQGARDYNIVAWQPLTNLPVITDRASMTQRVPVAQRLDIAIHAAYQASGPDGQRFLQDFFVPEAVETLEIHIDRFFQTDFFKAVYASTLSREQYIYSMSNLHQFVRYTTRLIGRAVSLSNDEDLRNHWLHHLSGEINHEKIIEKDLANLGADVDYVVNHMVPNVHNQQFMVTQESAIAFYQDPVLFMAAPFSAEGWTARLDARFMDALHKAVRGWGVQNPRHVTGFLSSHINYDGGEDGHWETSRKILGRYIRSDQMLQRFTNLVHLAMNAFERSYTSYVQEQRLWSAAPMHDKVNGMSALTTGASLGGAAS